MDNEKCKFIAVKIKGVEAIAPVQEVGGIWYITIDGRTVRVPGTVLA